MSYELTFWQYNTEPGPKRHQSTYRKLSEGERIKGLNYLPVDDIFGQFDALLISLGWSHPDYSFWKQNAFALEILSTPQFIRLDCYDVPEDMMNRFIELVASFGAPLYEPQANTRSALA